MAAPEHVRISPEQATQSYGSPDHVPSAWSPDRPGDLDRRQPNGEQFGWQGPDQGYGLLLARRMRDKLQVGPGEDEEDAIAGGLAIALRRASMFGRAPVIHDFTVAFTLWGFLDRVTPAELVALRRKAFEGLANPHHYVETRDLVESVPEASLRSTPDAVRRLHEQDWRRPLGLYGRGDVRRRLVAGLVGTLVVVLVWVATHTSDPRDDEPPIGGPIAGATTTVAVAGGRVQVELAPVADDAAATTAGSGSGSATTDAVDPGLRWDVDLAGAADRGQAAICGTSKGFHLAVLDRAGEGPVVGMTLRADAVSATSDVAVAGAFVMAEGDDVALQGTLRLNDADIDPAGTLTLRDDDGQDWTGTFRCSGP